MTALTKFLAGGVAAAALFSAAPAAAQYYPNPYGYGSGNVVGQVLNQVLGGGYGGYNQQAATSQCAAAVQQRLQSNYGYGYNPYGYGQYGYAGGARVLGISRVEPRSNGGLTVRGVATTGMNGGYAYGGQQPVDLTWKCKIDYRGYISDIDIDRAAGAYGYNYSPYDPYAAYGYRRY